MYRNSATVAVLHLRSLSTGQEHQHASQSRLRYNTDWWGIPPPGERVSIQQVQICGSTIALSIRLQLDKGDGTTELALFDWRLGGAPLRTVSFTDLSGIHSTLTPTKFTSDTLFFDIISETRILVVSQPEDDEDDSSNSSGTSYDWRSDGLYVLDRGKRPPQISVCNIQRGREHSIPRIRSYEFPESWSTVSFLQQCPNSSSKDTAPPLPGTLFCNDPSLRLTAVTFEFAHHARPAGCSRKVVVVIGESKLESADAGEEVVRWEEWQDLCMVLNLPDHADAVQLAGRRLVFFEHVKNDDASSRDPSSRVHSLDLNPYIARYLWSLSRRNPPWRWQESWTSISTVFDHRGSRYVRTSTAGTHHLTWIDTTEDSLVLYDVSFHPCSESHFANSLQEREGQTRVRILTFGQEMRFIP